MEKDATLDSQWNSSPPEDQHERREPPLRHQLEKPAKSSGRRESSSGSSMEPSEHEAPSEPPPPTAQQEASIFQFRRQPELLSTKSSGRRGSKTSTPRNLIVPDVSDVAMAQLSTAPYQAPSKLEGSAKKYLTADAASAKPAAPSDKKEVHIKPPRSFKCKLDFFRGTRGDDSGAHPNEAFCGVRSISRALGHLTLQQSIGFMLLLVGMLSESGTPAPRYNTPLGMAIFLLPVATDDGAVDYLQHQHHRLYITGLAMATAIDFVWLMRPEEGAYNGYVLASVKSWTDVWIALCSFAKISLIFCSYLELVDTEPPLDDMDMGTLTSLPVPPPSFRLWDTIKFFFPRRTLPKRAQLSLEVLHRVLVLAWIHLLCGLLLLALGLIATAWYSGRTQFRVKPVGVPLHVMLLIKAATTLLTYLTVSHRINYDACLELYGLRTRDANSRIREVEGVQVRLPQEPVLAYNRPWLRRVERAKVLDGVAGGYLLLVFYAALRSGEVVGGQGVPTLLACTALVQLLLDVWTPLLILVAARCGSALHKLHHRGIPGTDPLFPPQLRWEDSDDDEDSSSDDSPDSDDDTDDDSVEEDDDLSEQSSSSSDSDADRTPAERRARRLRHRQQRLERLRGSLRDPQLPIVDAEDVEADEDFRQTSEIATARDVVDNANTSGKGAWVRHYHKESDRNYLVHSLTGEAVWEIVTTPRLSARKPDRPTSALSLSDFEDHWNKLEDSGGFNCRVSRIPEAKVLARHLEKQDFRVASDGLRPYGAYQRRTVLFYADDSHDSEEPEFMGEFVFDSLSLKMCARFRCVDSDEMVVFVKRLQLKEIVGNYSPCD